MKLKVSFDIMQMEDGYVAVASGSEFNGIIRLNSSARLLFEFIQKGVDEQTILETVSNDYNVSKEMVQEDYRVLVESLRREGLLEE